MHNVFGGKTPPRVSIGGGMGWFRAWRQCPVTRGACRGRILAGLIAAIQALIAHQPHDPLSVVAASPNYLQDQTIFVGTSALTMPLPIAEYVPLTSTKGGFTFSVMPGLPNLPMLSIGISPGYATDGT